MDWLEFFSTVIEALAWPIAAVWIVFLFKNALIERIPALLRLNLPGGISAEFEAGVERMVAAADRSEEPPVLSTVQASGAENTPEDAPPLLDPESPLQPDFRSTVDPMTVMANPTGVVMEAWKVLESSVSTAFMRLGGMQIMGRARGRAPMMNWLSRMLQFLMEQDFLTSGDLENIRELERLRNLAARASQPTSPAAAKSFANLAEQMAARFNQRLEEAVATRVAE